MMTWSAPSVVRATVIEEMYDGFCCVRTNGGTGVLGNFLSIIFYDRQRTLRVLFKEMMKCMLAFFSGAVAVTSFVVASGARTSWLVVLGFIVATLCYGLLAAVIGPRRLARFLLWIAGERQKPRRPRRVSALARKSEVEQDVISALTQQGASRRAAMKAAAASNVCTRLIIPFGQWL